jgi:hypothetical protein
MQFRKIARNQISLFYVGHVFVNTKSVLLWIFGHLITSANKMRYIGQELKDFRIFIDNIDRNRYDKIFIIMAIFHE